MPIVLGKGRLHTTSGPGQATEPPDRTLDRLTRRRPATDRPTTTQTPPATTPCRVLLRAIAAALRLPYPATEADEHAYYVLRSKRASLALQAIERIGNDPDAGASDMLVSADVLTGQLADYPPAGYAHHPMSS